MNKLFLDYEPTSPYLDDAKRELFVSRLPEVRAARIRSPRHIGKRAERAACEAALRRVLRTAGERYADIRIAYTETGKPYIDGRPDLAVSFSHTSSLAAVALVTSDGIAPAVGMDIAEVGTAPAHRDVIADKYFSPAEQAMLKEKKRLRDAENSGSTPILQEDDGDLFLSIWCRMEARVKMTGEGIAPAAHAVEPPARHHAVISLAGVPRHFLAVATEEIVEIL